MRNTRQLNIPSRSTASLAAIAFLIMTLAGCASNTYQEATGSRGHGYQDAALEDGRYRVTFRGSAIDSAYDFALLRAAEITLLEGYQWFRITDSVSEEHDSRYGGSSVSVGTGYGDHGRHGSSIGVGVGLPLGHRNQTVVQSFNIQLGKGTQPEGEKIYSAASVQATIGPRAAT